MLSNDITELKFKSRSRAPIIWILLPLVAGYIGARLVKVPENLLLLGTLVVGGLGVYIWWKYQNLWYWRALGVLSIFLISWSYMLTQHPLKSGWEDKPEREVYLSLKIIQPKSFEDNRIVGYAEVIGAAKHLQDLVGQKIYYFLYGKNEPECLIRSAVIEVKGVLSVINSNSGNNYDKYLCSQGIGFKLYKGQFIQLICKANPFYEFCAKQNKRMEKILEKGYGSNCLSSTYKAMLLGNQMSLSTEQKNAFRITGSLHLFSISGLHVGVIAGCFAFLLSLLKIKNPWSAIIGIGVLFLYVQITGGSPSAMRAFLMVVFYWGGRACQRKSSAFSALTASAVVALIINPFDLWNIGFQLSYAVVGCILLYGLPLNELTHSFLRIKFHSVHRFIKNGLGWILNLLGISIAANIGTAFLSICYFNIFAPGSIILSLLIIPLSSLIIIIGFVSLLTGILGLTFISGLINPISWMMIEVMEWFIFFSLKIPGLFLDSFIATPVLTYISLAVLFTFLYWSHCFNQLRKSFFYLIPLGMVTTFVCFGI